VSSLGLWDVCIDVGRKIQIVIHVYVNGFLFYCNPWKHLPSHRKNVSNCLMVNHSQTSQEYRIISKRNPFSRINIFELFHLTVILTLIFWNQRKIKKISIFFTSANEIVVDIVVKVVLFVVFVFVLCLVCLMLPVSIDWPFLTVSCVPNVASFYRLTILDSPRFSLMYIDILGRILTFSRFRSTTGLFFW
jgi:hypothetical protein